MALVRQTAWLAVRMIIVLVSVTFLVFILVEISPLDPVAQYVASMQRGVSAEQLAAIAERWGVDTPWYQRYFSWLGGMLQGDFGLSVIYRAEVSSILAYAIGNSFIIMTIAWVVSGILGYVLGLAAGAYRGTLADRAIVTFSYIMTSTPAYVVGLVLLLIFAVRLGWVPIGLSHPLGVLSADVTLADRARHAVLPALTVALVAVAQVIVHTREAMSQVMDSEVARFGRARGFTTWQIIRHHGIRLTILPAIMLQFTSLSMIFGGSALAEVVFSYHGLGLILTNAGLKSDVPLLLGAVTVTAVLVFVGNFIADVISLVIDPRVRRSVDETVWS